MVGSVKQIAIRLKPEGGAEVVAEARKAEEALVGAANRSKTATEAAVAAADRQVQKLREVAAQASVTRTPVQANIDRITGVSTGGNARADVAARTLYAADERAAEAAARIRAEIDPLAAATDRYNAELREMASLQARGHLTAQEFARGQELAKNRLDATTAALGRNTSGLTRNQMASRLNLTRQAADVAVTASMGMNPAMIAMQQGPQIADALATSGLKASASMLALGGALAVAAGAVVVLGGAYLQAEGSYLALDRAATGLGRTAGLTADQLQGIAREGARAAEISVSAAEKQAAAFVSTGRIGGEAIGGLIALSKDYAAFMGQDAAEATQSLATAMLDPTKAAEQWTREFGLLDQATINHIESLQKHGREAEAHAILIDALSDAVSGHADKISDVESAWDAAARAVSNYFDWLGKALYTTPTEELAKVDRASMANRARANNETGRQRELLDQAFERLQRRRVDLINEIYAPTGPANADENQAAQLAEDRRRRTRPRVDRSAEREAREALARRRQEEDRAWQIEMALARSIEDYDHIRALEEEEAIRTRIRQLVDDDVDAETARATAMQEQARLNEGREAAELRAFQAAQQALGIELDRLLGNERTLAVVERQEELDRRILTYRKEGLDLERAKAVAAQDMLELDKARTEVMRREVDLAAEAHALTLARLAGDERRTRQLEIQERIAQRAREIERREKLNHGEGEDRARAEIKEEVDAEADGARRSWVKGFIADIRQGGIRDALADQFEQAADRLIDRLIDMLFDMDWSAILGGTGGGSSGGLGGLLSGGLSAIFGGGSPVPGPIMNFGRNARGTDFWSGGWTWVGEEGPELIRAPRGAQIADADRSRRIAAAAGGGAQGAYVDRRTYHFSGNLLTPEWWAEIHKRDRAAAQAGADHGAAVAVSTVHSTAPAVQHAESMLRA